MAEYKDSEAIKTAWLKVAQDIISRADDEEQEALKRYTQRVWDCGVFAERLSEEGQEAVWGIHQRRNSERAGALMLYEKLHDLPAADVAPVVHAHWIEQSPDFDLCGVAYYKCSECGKEQQLNSHYCQFCGAKMDERSEDK